jgi:predicted RNase H-like HicB family nuclease
MYRITAIIEKGPDGRYAISSEQSFGRNHFGGYGDTVEMAKADFRESVETCLEFAKEDGISIPDEYQIAFKYDVPSFFEDFDFINASRFAQYAGINESKMRQYKCGVAFPGERTTRKILDAIHRIGAELSSVSI